MNSWFVRGDSYRNEFRPSYRLLLFWAVDNTPISVRSSENSSTCIFFPIVFSIFGSSSRLDKNGPDVMYFHVLWQSRLRESIDFSMHQIHSLKFSQIERRQMESSKMFLTVLKSFSNQLNDLTKKVFELSTNHSNVARTIRRSRKSRNSSMTFLLKQATRES